MMQTNNNNWEQWSPTHSRATPKHVRGSGYETEPLTAAEAEALELQIRAAFVAAARRTRVRYIEAGVIVPMGARIASDGTTVFRNLAKLPVFSQGKLTAKQLSAMHPAEVEAAERHEKKRERTRDRE